MNLHDNTFLAGILACPFCHEQRLALLEDGRAACRGCGAEFGSRDGAPLLLGEEILAAASADWDNVAPQYELFAPKSGYDIIDGPLIEICEGDVLDVGCGDGRMMALVRDRCQNLVGVDPSPSMTAIARDRGFLALTAGAEDLPFRDGSFDHAISGYCSLRYADQPRAFKEIARVTKTGGLLAFTLWNFNVAVLPGCARSWLRGRRPTIEWAYFRKRDVSGIRALEQKLNTAGLHVTEIRSTPFPEVFRRLVKPLFSYYRGRWGVRLGYNVIVTCRKAT